MNGNPLASGSYDYDAFGNAKGDYDIQVSPFGYCGEYTDKETGLVYLRNRYYEPRTGAFTQEDPIRDGGNWYGYCGGNPVALVDPSGLSGIWDNGGAVPKEYDPDNYHIEHKYDGQILWRMQMIENGGLSGEERLEYVKQIYEMMDTSEQGIN